MSVKFLEREKYIVVGQISRKGEIYSCRSKKNIRPFKNPRGYLVICLCVNNHKKKITVHRLLANTFLPNPNNKEQINHKNGIKTDNRLENLEWVSNSENRKHAWDTGLQPRHYSEEMRRKLSISTKGRIPWNKGKKLPPMPKEQREKISTSMKIYRSLNSSIDKT